jgi:hypothetical protein
MDSIYNILSKRGFDEPPEIARIKAYVREHYKSNVGVQVRERDILLIVPSAALANTLRFKMRDMQKVCELDKKLSFRIGQ